jgi:hypothetical protein
MIGLAQLFIGVAALAPVIATFDVAIAPAPSSRPLVTMGTR